MVRNVTGCYRFQKIPPLSQSRFSARGKALRCASEACGQDGCNTVEQRGPFRHPRASAPSLKNCGPIVRVVTRSPKKQASERGGFVAHAAPESGAGVATPWVSRSPVRTSLPLLAPVQNPCIRREKHCDRPSSTFHRATAAVARDVVYKMRFS
jgi:hypothetical protein